MSDELLDRFARELFKLRRALGDETPPYGCPACGRELHSDWQADLPCNAKCRKVWEDSNAR